MCGIAGVVGQGADDAHLLRRMADAIAHRGPDDEGVWSDPAARVGFAHRRLSIVDLSPAGHQPMHSRDDRYVIVYNGEIYNHAELRVELERAGIAPVWRGHSDTEVLLEAICAWGLGGALRKCVGMFALALWDKRERRLHLARDRFGEKPLYYGWCDGAFLFGSELKALRAHPGFTGEIERRAVRLLAARTYIPGPLSIYRDIYKLEPGTIFTASAEALATARSATGISIERYWSYRDVVASGLADRIEREEEALELLEAALATAIRGQALADVPVGAFLSGGIDSSLVVGLYQKYSNAKVRTFSIGFREAGFNEAEYAKAVARHFGTEHNERYVTEAETRDVLPLLPAMYDEPFADSSQIPTFLVSRFAREQVTVALSGDGGDELFGGYNRYVSGVRLWRGLRKAPRPLREAVGGALGRLDAATWNRLLALVPGGPRAPHLGTKVRKAFRTMGKARDINAVFDSLLDEWSGEASPVIGGECASTTCPFDLDLPDGASDAERMMFGDVGSYLRDEILVKVDRAAMAVSLETRVPFLDHRVAEVAARIPITMKIAGGTGKNILRKLLYREAPAELFDRPKAGFGVPVGQWIKGPLRPWAEALLDPARLTRDGYFDAAIVQRRWSQHLRDERDSTPALWAILMFNAWLDEARASGAAA